VSDFESDLRARLWGVVDEVGPDTAWEGRIEDALAESRRTRRASGRLSLLAAAAVVVAIALPLGLGLVRTQSPQPVNPDPTSSLPTWAQQLLLNPAAPPTADARSRLGTIRYVGSTSMLVPDHGGRLVEITGLGDPTRTRPQWTSDSALVLVRPVGSCPEIAELHMDGDLEQLLRRCDALGLSPDGTTLLLGYEDGEGAQVTVTGFLDLASGRRTDLPHDVQVAEPSDAD
jgi:hypothetical protein